ncbi:MAG: hypothetical protein KDB22_25335 [Planctomycetales bacterium]|nr:hypothetical protein [Planctomycetales bacterium]
MADQRGGDQREVPGNPKVPLTSIAPNWIPAYAGMTDRRKKTTSSRKGKEPAAERWAEPSFQFCSVTAVTSVGWYNRRIQRTAIGDY